jgi:undecaprenyl diphosphate synthase|tara:strand:+ start:1816 stop:2487 length:672 start_codon:yes stop_codon:yes gene_type:complete
MDGNGRWANKRFLPRLAGHKKGLDALQIMVKASVRHSISTITLYAFSTENWNRPDEEIKGLMALFSDSISSQTTKLIKNDIRVRILGDTSIFSKELQSRIKHLENKSSKNKGLNLNIALNYGARSEILMAANKFFKNSKSSKIPMKEKDLNNNLYTKKMPDVDLLIRTGGQRRLSNFLLWQAAYSELYFTNTLWPDFSEKDFVDALYFFQNTERKFGNLKGNK